MTVTHFQTTQGGDQTLSSAPLWEARMSNSHTLSDHPGGRSTAYYSAALGGHVGHHGTIGYRDVQLLSGDPILYPIPWDTTLSYSSFMILGILDHTPYRGIQCCPTSTNLISTIPHTMGYHFVLFKSWDPITYTLPWDTKIFYLYLRTAGIPYHPIP